MKQQQKKQFNFIRNDIRNGNLHEFTLKCHRYSFHDVVVKQLHGEGKLRWMGVDINSSDYCTTLLVKRWVAYWKVARIRVNAFFPSYPRLSHPSLILPFFPPSILLFLGSSMFLSFAILSFSLSFSHSFYTCLDLWRPYQYFAPNHSYAPVWYQDTFMALNLHHVKKRERERAERER